MEALTFWPATKMVIILRPMVYPATDMNAKIQRHRSKRGLVKPSLILSIMAALLYAADTPLVHAEEMAAGHESTTSQVRLNREEYADKVYAAWLGQIIGNIYGLSYEFQFIDEPGPDNFPYGFGDSLERVEEANGAFSDDDTDIEYMYLLQMEKHGIEPTYRQLADAWKYHGTALRLPATGTTIRIGSRSIRNW
jgi:hypothetical protein